MQIQDEGLSEPSWVARFARKRKLVSIAIAIVAAILVLVFRFGGLLMPLELRAYDPLLSMRSWMLGGEEAESRVVLVTIGEGEFSRFGYPIPSGTLAAALEAIGAHAPRAIGLDLYREVPREAEEGWTALEQAVASDPRIVTIHRLSNDSNRQMPRGEEPRLLGTPERMGFNDVVVDPSKVIRRGYLIDWDEEDRPAVALSLRLALLHLQHEGVAMSEDKENPDYIRLGATTIPAVESSDGGYRGVDSHGYQFLLDYARGESGFPTYTLSSVMDGDLPNDALAERVVLIGTDAWSVKDDFHTPFDLTTVTKGMTVHAYVTDQLLRIALDGERPIWSLSEFAETLWIVLWSIGAAQLSRKAKGFRVLFVIAVGGVAVIGLAGFGGMVLASLWLPTVPAALVWLASSTGVTAYISQRARAEKRAVMGFFRRFTSRKVADELWRRRDEFMDGSRPRPQRLVVTALLSDLKGYTEAAEKMDPGDLMEWINTYMDAMTRVIEAHDGHVDDYVGDGIKANFGVPFPSVGTTAEAADARRAVDCALEMGDELARLNVGWSEQGLPTGRQRIGLATGPVVVGSVGSAERMKYTTVGDTVNTSARLESFSAPGHEFAREDALYRVLISESTFRLVGSEFETESIGEHSLKGKGESVRIYRVRRSDSSGVSTPIGKGANNG